MQNICSLYFWFDEYDYEILRDYLKLSIGQCIIV